MPIAKVRFHKGVTQAFRRRLRTIGIALDEEIAQQILAGRQAVNDPEKWRVDEERRIVLDTQARQRLMTSWETDNPNKNAYPKPFAERVRELASEASRILDDDGDPSFHLAKIIEIARAELSDDDFLPDYDES